MRIRDYCWELFYPGIIRLGASPFDGTLQFYAKVCGLLPEDATVLDFGAGSGDSLNVPDSWRRDLLLLKPKCTRRMGCDIDPVVRKNPFLEEAFILKGEEAFSIPLANESVDAVLADWVIEHVPDPGASFAEIWRVLREGGWFFARTGNLWHYSYTIARLVRNSRLEARLIRAAQPGRKEESVCPKFFRANKKRVLRRCLLRSGFRSPIVLSWEPEPAYVNFHLFALVLGALYQRFATLGLLPHSTLMVFAQKGCRTVGGRQQCMAPVGG